MICLCPNCDRKLSKRELGIRKVKCKDCGFTCGGLKEFEKKYPNCCFYDYDDYEDTTSDCCRQCGNFEHYPDCKESCGIWDDD